jgi:pimeloyl-ACP methyl ester carboxylesterase
MAQASRLVKSLTRLIFPTILLIVTAVAAGSVWLVYSAARPVKTTYLVTPEKYGRLSTRAAQITDENWPNSNGSSSRGWLLRGIENGPAVILVHKYGADRSYVLNLGVKLNESTNYTVLMPDLRGHGENPSVQNASFGGCEAEDLSSAVQYLRGLKGANGNPLVGKNIGVYGVEMGALAALTTAAKDQGITAVAVDSVPQDSDDVVREAVVKRYPFGSGATTKLAKLGTYLYFYDGCFRRQPACDVASGISAKNVMLLAGIDAADFQDSTSKLSKCFPAGSRLQSFTNLSPSGYSIVNASLDQSDAYDQRLIDFFHNSLEN